MNKQFKELQKEIRITAKLLLIGILILTIFSFIGSVSASSIIGQIPDMTLGYNTTGTTLWLWDYYNVDQNEVITIKYIDPINGNLINLRENYASLNLECFEIGYRFADRGNGWYEDVLDLQTYGEDCYVDIYLDFASDSQLDQEFRLTVSSGGQSGESPINYNISGTILNGLHSYMDFNDNVQEKVSNKVVTVSSGTPTYSTTSKYGKGLIVDTSDLVVDISNLVSGLTAYPNRNNAISFWARFNSGCTPSGLYDHLLKGSFGQSYAPAFYYTAATPTAGFIGYQMPYNGGGASGWEADSGDYRDNTYHFIVINQNSSKSLAYVDNVAFGSQYSTTGDFSYLQIGDVDNNCPILIDDLAIWSKNLNTSDRTALYNSGTGLNFSAYNIAPQNQGSGTNIYMNTSQNYSLSLQNYFTGEEDIFVSATDPINSGRKIKIYTGYSTLNADYFELNLNNTGGLKISSYERPYNFSFVAGGCVYTPVESCTNMTFNVYILGSAPEVIQLNQLQAIYDLGLDTTYTLTFAGNYYYQYYDKFIFSFPESNFTGILGNGSAVCPYCRGNWDYEPIQEPVLNASYMVFLECNNTGAEYTYTYYGDINITAECGGGQSYFTLSPFNNYNQRVYFTGKNDINSISDYTQLYSGNKNYPSGYVPTTIEPDTTAVDENINEFGGVLPQNLSDKNKHRVTFLVLFIINGLIIVGLFRQGTLCLFACLIATTIILFLFASQSYITNLYPVLTLFITLGLGAMKVVRGG